MNKKTITIITIMLSFICAGLEFLCMSEILHYVRIDDASKINTAKILIGVIILLALARLISGYIFYRSQESHGMLSKFISGIVGMPILSTACFAGALDFWIADRLPLSAPVAVIIMATIIAWAFGFLVIIGGTNSMFWLTDMIKDLIKVKRNTVD